MHAAAEAESLSGPSKGLRLKGGTEVRETRRLAPTRGRRIFVCALLAGITTSSQAEPIALPGGPYRLTARGSTVLSGITSNSAEGRIERYEWDIDGDGTFGDLTGAEPTLVWSQFPFAVGTWTVVLKVIAPSGASATAPATLAVTSSPLAVHDQFRFLGTSTGEAEAAPVIGPDGRLYGTTSAGLRGAGALWRMNADGSGFFVLRFFGSSTGGSPGRSTPVFGPDGRIYGSTTAAVWRINTDGTDFVVLRSLEPATHGFEGSAGPVLGPDLRLYGTSVGGGQYGGGAVWRMNLDGGGLTLLRHFDGATEGRRPYAAPVFGADGMLYGTTAEYAAKGAGALWRMKPDGSDFAVLHVFTWNDGANSRGLVAGADGNIYGLSAEGGSDVGGALWRFEPAGMRFTLLFSFPYGSPPGAGPRWGADGKLYGTTAGDSYDNAGTIWRIKPDGTEFAVLRTLERTTDGAAPQAAPWLDANGVLFGTTRYGGATSDDEESGAGTVWRMKTDGTGFVVLKDFDLTTRTGTGVGRVAFLPDGRVVGAGEDIDLHNRGRIWRMNADGSGLTILRVFDDDPEGRLVSGGPVVGPDGRIYGICQTGGTDARGDVWRMNSDGSEYAVLRTFQRDSDGAMPLGPPVFDLDGRLYGACAAAGAEDKGTIWRMNSDGSGFVVLTHFTRAAHFAPASGVVFGWDGKLYGVGEPDTADALGTVWRANADGSDLRVLREFASAEGGPYTNGPIAVGADGTLYGSGYSGGNNGHGTVWKIGADGSRFAVLRHFDSGSDGGAPYEAPVFGTDGRLYGTCSGGGLDGMGTLWRMNPDGSDFVVLNAFSEVDGANPVSAPAVAPDGRLFGTTLNGGSEGLGPLYVWLGQSATAGGLANGGFEAGGANWTANGNVEFVARGPRTAAEGNAVALFNAGERPPNGVLSQRIATVAGTSYAIRFALGVLAYNQRDQRLEISVVGRNTMLFTTVSILGAGGGGVRWRAESLRFVADGPDMVVTLRDVSTTTGAIDMMVDHVRVEPWRPLVDNGSFESGYAGWTATGNQVAVQLTPGVPTDGTRAVVFNNGNRPPNGVLLRTVPTTAGQQYTISFDVGVLAYARAEQRLELGVQGASTRLLETTSLVGVADGARRWVTCTYVFEADSAQTTLRFRDVSPATTSIDLLLDNIRLE